jgi:hypothetical protein
MVRVSITVGRSKLHNEHNHLYFSLIIAEMTELIRNGFLAEIKDMCLYVFKELAKTHSALVLRPVIVFCDEGGKKCIKSVCQ